MHTTLIPLGTNGFHPSYSRQTMSFLFLGDRGAGADTPPLLIDAGTGLSRLSEPAVRERLENVDSLDIVLSHYHLDHTVGLSYLSGAWGRSARIHAPGPPLVDAEPEEALHRLIGPPLFPLSLDQYPSPINLERYSEGPLRLCGLEIEVRRQQHPGGSVGLRFGDSFAYVTDTRADDETIDFVRGVDLLLHELWVSPEEARENPKLVLGHAAADEVLRIAKAAGVARLAPVHHHPKRTDDELETLLEGLESQSVEVVPLVDGLEVELRPNRNSSPNR